MYAIRSGSSAGRREVKMAVVYDVEASRLIEGVAKELSRNSKIKMPDWAQFVKTGPSKETVPARDDWWHVRASAILRTIYSSKGPIGVQKLRIKYGSKKNRGHKPSKFYMASGKIIRLILQQLEASEYLKQDSVGVHKGRVITPKGKSLLDKSASKIVGKVVKKPVTKEASEKKPEPKKVKPTEKKPDKESTEKVEAKPTEKQPDKESTEKVEAKPTEKQPDKESIKSEDKKPEAKNG